MTPPGLPRRVLITTDTVGGVWNYALELSGALGGHGVAVVLATMGPRARTDQRTEAARLENVTLCESEFPLEWMSAAWKGVEAAGEWLLDLEQRFAPDLVHLNGYAHGALPWSAPTVVVAHSCVFSWWRAVRGCRPPAEWKRYAAMTRAGLHAADAVVAPTHAMLEALQEHYGPRNPRREQRDETNPSRRRKRRKEAARGAQEMPTLLRAGEIPSGGGANTSRLSRGGLQRFTTGAACLGRGGTEREDRSEPIPRGVPGFTRSIVIPNGRDPAQFTSAAAKEPFVLSVGRLWDDAKNAAALVAIAPRIAWPVRVAGSTAAPDGGERMLPNVESLGCCSRCGLADQYARASIYALPARYEPFGLSALEAALSGCALVLGDIPSLREIWEGAALFVPPNDHEALREAIAELIDDPSLRQWLGVRARMRGSEFTVERMAGGYLDVYRELLLVGNLERPAAIEPVLA